jgi:hypothetical protein
MKPRPTRRRRLLSTRFSVLLSSLLAVAACDAGETAGTGGDGGGVGDFLDTDGDTISDVDEGISAKRDTDADGTPDYQDLDSDADSIPDAVEAGDADLQTPPLDSDADSKADFVDLDSDENGAPDIFEGGDDFDADGIINSADPDNDGDLADDKDEFFGVSSDCNDDGLPDAQGTPAGPQDCDADGTANFLDADSDGDSVPDRLESPGADTDGDGFLDRYDLDSDGDTFSDSLEAGDSDPGTPPVDTDMDGTADYLDKDSDNDGLTDLLEAESGSDPLVQDTDMDGVNDLIEWAAGTDPQDPIDTPQANGDFVFLVPYMDETDPLEDTLEFRTSIQFADLYFTIDQTGSMSQEFNTLQSTLSQIIDTLACDVYGGTCVQDSECGADQICFNQTCIADPNVGVGCVPDLYTGVGLFEDLNSYHNYVSLQPNPQVTAQAINAMGFPGGSEAIYQPPACVANPAACPGIPFASMGCASTGVGCPGYRPEAIRIYLHVSDADNQCFGTGCATFTPNYAAQLLIQQDIKFVALYGTDDGSQQLAQYNALAILAGSVDADGNPFVYPAADAAVQQQTVQAVLDIVRGKPIDVTIAAEDEPNDAGDAIQFIDYLESNTSGVGNCTAGLETIDTDANSHDDAFPQLLPGIPVCWDVHPVPMNTTVPPTDEPQLFIAKLKVLGDGSLVDGRNVYFLVPPSSYVPM